MERGSGAPNSADSPSVGNKRLRGGRKSASENRQDAKLKKKSNPEDDIQDADEFLNLMETAAFNYKEPRIDPSF